MIHAHLPINPSQHPPSLPGTESCAKLDSPAKKGGSSWMSSMIRSFACFLIGVLLYTGYLQTPSPRNAPQPTTWLGPRTPDNFDVIKFDTQEPDDAGFADWVADIKEQSPRGAIIIIGHGNEECGFWTVHPTQGFMGDAPVVPCPMPLLFVVRELRAESPDRPIYVVSCNGEHDRALSSVPNVFYPTSVVWITPDKYCSWWERTVRHAQDPDVVGDLREFVWSGLSPASH